MKPNDSLIGTIVADAIKKMNIKWTLAGHTAIFNDINVILCIGENLKDREAGKTSEVTAR